MSKAIFKTMQAPSVWVDGVPGESIPANDRGLAYGDGVFETIRVSCGQPVMADLHWRRLSDSTRRLAIDLDFDQMIEEVATFLSGLPGENGILKLVITRGSGGRGYNPLGSGPARRIMSFHPLPYYPSEPAQNGISLFPCQTRLGQSRLAGMKHLNRLENVMARAEWRDSQHLEGLLRDWQGRLVEGTMSNLFLVQGRCLVTPSLERCGVSGVCREYILQQVDTWGLQAVEKDVDWQQFEQADEVFTCNSVNGVWPVIACENLRWPVGPVSSEVRDRILDVINV